MALTCATEEDLGRACLAVVEEVTGSRLRRALDAGFDAHGAKPLDPAALAR